MPEINHVPVLVHFLREVKPATAVELGCTMETTPILDQMALGWVTSYHNNRHSIESFRHSCQNKTELDKTDIVLYDNHESLFKYWNEAKDPPPDLCLIGGPVLDRLLVAQYMLDCGAKCIILLNYDYPACNYHKLRSVGYEFKSFNNIVEGGETAVYMVNPLRYVEIVDHVPAD